MRDPREGITSDGMIVTGADRDRVPASFEPILDAVVKGVTAADPQAVAYLYGSVATGQARLGRSDVDLLVIGLDADIARALGRELSERFGILCRGVEIGAARPDDMIGDSDDAYGFRVFLRHYCVPLVGVDRYRPARDFLADVRAARGFNGDIAEHRRRWGAALDAMTADELDELAVRMARKTLLAVAGLVSLHDDTWTTDRETASRRWGELEPDLADGLATLGLWVDGVRGVDLDTVERILFATVTPVAVRFADRVGLWPDAT